MWFVELGSEGSAGRPVGAEGIPSSPSWPGATLTPEGLPPIANRESEFADVIPPVPMKFGPEPIPPDIPIPPIAPTPPIPPTPPAGPIAKTDPTEASTAARAIARVENFSACRVIYVA
jgi:hypothetical protein